MPRHPFLLPWELNAGPSPEEIQAWRMDKLIGNVIREAVDRQEFKQHSDFLLAQDANRKMASFCLTMITDGDNGRPEIIHQVLGEAPPHLQELIEQEPPFMCTGVMWNNMAMAGRVELCAAGHLPDEIALCSDVYEILPDETDTYLAQWQRVINSGICWNVAGHVGRRARFLQEQGFLLEAPEYVKGTWNDGISRHDVPPGLPGSPAFVRTMMGEAYLSWIEAVR